MFCRKCGKELTANEMFCSNCGTKNGETGEPKPAPRKNYVNAENIKDTANRVKSGFESGLSSTGRAKPFLFILAGLLLLTMFFSLSKVFKISSLFGVSQSLGMFELSKLTGDSSMPNLSFLIAVSFIAAIVLIFLPLMIRKRWKSVYFLCAKIISIFSFVMFLIVYISMVSEADDQYGALSGLADLSITFSGWMFILCCVASIVFSFIVPLMIKRNITQYNGAELLGARTIDSYAQMQQHTPEEAPVQMSEESANIQQDDHAPSADAQSFGENNDIN